MAVDAPHRITADEYLADETPTRWHQLIEGEVVVSEPNLRHQAISGEIWLQLTLWLRAAPGRGYASLPVDVRISEYNVFGPDVIWVSEAKRPADNQTDFRDYLPDLCVEVRSRGTWRYDLHVKKRRYEEAGLSELWLVDTAADVVMVFRRNSPESTEFDVAVEFVRGQALTSPLLRGFALNIDALFDR